ncbi:MAG TPA: hypothetical protein VEY11_00355 [Pyrinomonadaceae bacterium]|nr:hypothetical protein [Pyrinomonadaceae bacterium]
MNTIYENIYIGVFIYSLGFSVAKNEKVNSLSSAINLYQQTPGDTTLGDFFCTIGGRNLLIEFKKDWAEVNTEHKKPSKAKLLAELGQEGHLHALSLKTHFLASPYEFTGNERQLYFFPYAYLLGAGTINIEPMGAFIEKYLDQQLGSDGIEFAAYLEALRPVGQSAQSGGKELSGLIVNLNEQGGITCVAFDDVGTLQREIDKLDRVISQERVIERERSRDRGGPSR